MLEKGKAKSLLSKSPLGGEEVLLNNGDKFMVPSLPLGPKGEFFYDLLRQFETVDMMTVDGNRFMHNFFTEILKINYPALTLEDTDGLFSMSHVAKVLAVFYGADEQAMRRGAASPLPEQPEPRVRR